MNTHKQSTILVATKVVESLEANMPATQSAIETMPNLIAKLRDFDEPALADRLQAALDNRQVGPNAVQIAHAHRRALRATDATKRELTAHVASCPSCTEASAKS